MAGGKVVVTTPTGATAGRHADGPAAGPLATAALELARRFASGATLWCVAPAWPDHARHLAVEFVHPVVVGAKALPAVSLGGDVVSEARALTATGDVLAAIGPADDATLRTLLSRAEAWGLSTIWLGAGPRPPAGAADHVVWVDAPAGTAAHDGRLVLAYHLLWELTQVCFEHPGLLRPEAPCDDVVCTTCSDEGRPGEVIGDGTDGALVRTARGIESVDVTLLGDVATGDLVLVHAGIAIARVEVAT